MDLYLQIGFLFVVAIAFASYLNSFQIVDKEAKDMLGDTVVAVESSIDRMQTSEIKKFNNNPSVAGTDVYSLASNARKYGIAVLIQTIDQKGLVANYGYRLLNTTDESAVVIPRIVTNENSMQDTFNQNFMFSHEYLFTGATSANTSDSKTIGTYRSYFNVAFADNYDGTTYEFEDGLQQIESGALGNGSENTPRITTYRDSIDDVYEPGQHYSFTGSLYTKAKLQGNYNPHVSQLLNKNSVKYLDQNARYYSVFIRDAYSNEIVGVYLEQHGTDIRSGLATLIMISEGMISKPF